jgi:hypothetical protein
VRVDDIALGDLASADAIEASVAMDSLLGGNLRADEIHVRAPRISVRIDPDGDSDVARLARKLGLQRKRRTAPSTDEPRGFRRIVVDGGTLTARIAGLGEVSADGVELIPDGDSLRVVTGRVHLRGTGGLPGVQLDIAFARGAAELGLSRMRFGRVLAVGGNGTLATPTGTLAVRDLAAGRRTGAPLELRGAVDDHGIARPIAVDVAPIQRAVHDPAPAVSERTALLEPPRRHLAPRINAVPRRSTPRAHTHPLAFAALARAAAEAPVVAPEPIDVSWLDATPDDDNRMCTVASARRMARRPITNDLALDDDGGSPAGLAVNMRQRLFTPVVPTPAPAPDDGPEARHETLALAITVRAEQLPLRALAAFAPHAVDLAAARAGGTLTIKHRTTRAVLTGAGDATVTRSSLELTGAGQLEGVTVSHGAFAAAPVTLSGAVAASLTISPEAIAVSRATFDVGAIHLAASGWIHRGAPVAGQIDAHLTTAPCADLLASLPEQLRGPLDGMVAGGQLGGRARLAVDLSAPSGDGVELAHTFTGACTIAAEPPAADVTTLATSSEQRLADGSRARIGKGEPDYVELRTLPAHVAQAFVSAEDARFWHHDGFDFEQIARSLEIDLREHRLARGGSTISQQLVKNAFLVQRRSFDRKLQEAVLAWRLEQRLGKKQILERYLNIIELGPHVFGVNAAARYWFNTTARELTVRQAAFLAALTSQPTTMTRRIRRDGTIDADTTDKIGIILRALRRSGTIDPNSYETARTGALRFSATALRGD